MNKEKGMYIKQALTLDDFKKMERMERRYYDEAYITPAEEAFQWYTYDEQSIKVVCEDDRIVGFCNLFPIQEHVYRLIEQGTFNDSLLTYKDILKITETTLPVNLFLSCILVEEPYRKSGVTGFIIRSYWQYFNEWVEKGGVIQSVITDNVTSEGAFFSQKIGLSLYKVSDHHSKIYKGTFEDFSKHNVYL